MLCLYFRSYALVGIVLVGTALGVIAAAGMEKQKAAMQAVLHDALDEQEAQDLRASRGSPFPSVRSIGQAIGALQTPQRIGATSSQGVGSIASRACAPVSYAYTNCLSEETKKVLPSLGLLAVRIILGMLLAYFDNTELTVIETFYFAVITSTTIG